MFHLEAAKPSLPPATLLNLEEQPLPIKGLPTFVFWTRSWPCAHPAFLLSTPCLENGISTLPHLFHAAHSAADGAVHSARCAEVGLQTWVDDTALLLTSQAILSKSHDLSEPRLPHLMRQ